MSIVIIRQDEIVSRSSDASVEGGNIEYFTLLATVELPFETLLNSAFRKPITETYAIVNIETSLTLPKFLTKFTSSSPLIIINIC